MRLKLARFFPFSLFGSESRRNFAALYNRLRLLPFDFGADGTSAVVLESAAPGSAFMLAASARGDISLYRSDRAPLLGAAESEEVKQAGIRLAGFAESFIRSLGTVSEAPVRPAPGFVTISFVSPRQLSSAEVSREELEAGKHPLSALWFASAALSEQLDDVHRSCCRPTRTGAARGHAARGAPPARPYDHHGAVAQGRGAGPGSAMGDRAAR